MTTENFVTFVAGVRPNFVKLAPLVAAASREQVPFRIVHTGQHYDDNMSRVFFDELGIPDANVRFDIPPGSREERTQYMQERMSRELVEHRPVCVFVFGDVDSSVAASLAAEQASIPVVHYESGLRSHDPSLPEEKNRVAIDHIARTHFVTEPNAARNLKTEGESGRVYLVGNLMIDTLRMQAEAIDAEKVDIPKSPYIVLTLHRAGNVDDPQQLDAMIAAVDRLSNRVHIIMPVHPRTKAKLEGAGIQTRNITLSEPLSYVPFHALMKQAAAVITDSGGTADELAVMGIPCLFMRKNTEKPITVSRGTTTLVNDNYALLPALIDRILQQKYKKAKPIRGWDGHSAERIIKALKREYLQ